MPLPMSQVAVLLLSGNCNCFIRDQGRQKVNEVVQKNQRRELIYLVLTSEFRTVVHLFLCTKCSLPAASAVMS